MARREDVIAGKKIHVYINGDPFFAGRSFVVHPRTTRNFESLLGTLTDFLDPKFGAVRHLRTSDGSSEIKSLSELISGASYVAYGKKFIPLGYTDITIKPRQLPNNLPSPREHKRIVVSGRARKIVRHPVIINVYANNEPLRAAKRILLQPWIHKTWENVLEQISNKVPLRTGAIRQLIDLSSKTEVSFGADLQDQQYYVAVGMEKFRNIEYGLSPMLFTPKQQMAKRYPTLPPIEPLDRSSKTKTSLSAPSDGSKKPLHPKPPPAKRAFSEEEPVAEKKDLSSPELTLTPEPTPRKKEVTPPPESSPDLDLDDGTPTPGRNPASRAAASSKVSPIQEQKTPVSSSEGKKKNEDADTLKGESRRGSLQEGRPGTMSGSRPASAQETARTEATNKSVTPELELNERESTPLETTPRQQTPEQEPERDPTPKPDSPEEREKLPTPDLSTQPLIEDEEKTDEHNIADNSEMAPEDDAEPVGETDDNSMPPITKEHRPDSVTAENEESKPNSPQADQAQPAEERVESAAEEVKPAAEEEKPVEEEVKPEDEEVKPAGEETKPEDEEAKPEDEDVKPEANEVKTEEDVTPTATKPQSNEEESTPTDEEKPADDERQPADGEVKPAENEEQVKEGTPTAEKSDEPEAQAQDPPADNKEENAGEGSVAAAVPVATQG